MQKQPSQNNKRKVLNATDKTSQKISPPDINLGDLLETHLATLRTDNPDAYLILKENIEEGFFEEQQWKSALNTLADRILQTIKKPEEENAN